MGLQRPPFRIFLWSNALQRRSNIARNNRLGIGFSAKVAQRLTLDAKASDGDDGINASARLSYVSKRTNEIHIGYALGSLGLSGTSGIHNIERKITAGTKFKATDTVSGFIENSRGQHANRTTIAKTYGISYERTRYRKYTATLESEHVSETGHASPRRNTISFGPADNNQDTQTDPLRPKYSTETEKPSIRSEKHGGSAHTTRPASIATGGFSQALMPWFQNNQAAIFAIVNILRARWVRRGVPFPTIA